MAVWAAGGVSLPHLASSQYDYGTHSSPSQYDYGTHVSPSQLQPGDLAFLYQPVGHVEIYIGKGLDGLRSAAGQESSDRDIRALRI